MYSGGGTVVKMLVANKVDMATRAVSREEGQELARSLGTIFFECSAKTKVGVQNAFEELQLKVRISLQLYHPLVHRRANTLASLVIVCLIILSSIICNADFRYTRDMRRAKAGECVGRSWRRRCRRSVLLLIEVSHGADCAHTVRYIFV